jgi:hypothetical protein
VSVVRPDDLARRVDAERVGAEGGGGIVQGGVGAATIEKAVAVVAPIKIRTDDLARPVNSLCIGALGTRRGVVDGGVSAAA